MDTALNPYSSSDDLTISNADMLQPVCQLWFFDDSQQGVKNELEGFTLERSAQEKSNFDQQRKKLPVQQVANPQLIAFPWNNWIESVRIELSDQQKKAPGVATVIIQDPTKTKVLDWKRNGYLIPGYWARLDLGYSRTDFGTNIGPTFFGRVDQVEPVFRDNTTEIRVTFFEQTLDLLNSRISLYFPPGRTSAEAVTQIANYFLIPAIVVGDPPPPVLSEKLGYSDSGEPWYILCRIAEKVGWTIWMDSGILYFAPERAINTARPSLHLEYGGGKGNVFKAKVRHDALGGSMSAQTANLDTETGAIVSSKSDEPKTDLSSVLQSYFNEDLQRTFRSLAGYASSRGLNLPFMDPQTTEKIFREVAEGKPLDFESIHDYYALTYPHDEFTLGKVVAFMHSPGRWVNQNEEVDWDSPENQEVQQLGEAMFRANPEMRIAYDEKEARFYGVPANQSQYPIDVAPTHYEIENLPENQEEADALTQRNLEQRSFQEILIVEALGNWITRPKDKLQIRGLHQAYDGHWQIQEVVHTYSKKYYRVKIEACRKVSGDFPKNLSMETWDEWKRNQRAEAAKAEIIRRKTERMEVARSRLRHIYLFIEDWSDSVEPDDRFARRRGLPRFITTDEIQSSTGFVIGEDGERPNRDGGWASGFNKEERANGLNVYYPSSSRFQRVVTNEKYSWIASDNMYKWLLVKNPEQYNYGYPVGGSNVGNVVAVNFNDSVRFPPEFQEYTKDKVLILTQEELAYLDRFATAYAAETGEIPDEWLNVAPAPAPKLNWGN